MDPTLWTWGAAALSGAVVGLFLAVFGGGGSVLAAPLLLYFVGIGDPHVAIGTSAAGVALNAMTGLTGHARAGRVKWPCASLFAATGVVGALAGSTLAKQVDGQRLLLFFALAMVLIALSMLRKPRNEGDAAVRLDRRLILRLAPKVQLFSADVFGPRGSCEVETVIRAIRHAIDVWDCRVINLSLGVVEQKLLQLPKRQQLLKAVEDAYFRDVLLIAAAHNEHPFTRSYPAMFAPPLVSVDKGLFADPLRFAYKLVDQIEFQAHGRGYAGPFAREPATSWAAPHLTGIAARILSLRPGLKPFEVKTILYWLARAAEKDVAS